MPADPQAPKADERRWVLANVDGGRLVVSGNTMLAIGERVEVVPASLVASLQEEVDRLRSLAVSRQRAIEETGGCVEDGGAWEDRAKDAEAHVARLQARVRALEQMCEVDGCSNCMPGIEWPDETAIRADERARVLRELSVKLGAMEDPFTPSGPGWDAAIGHLSEWLASLLAVEKSVITSRAASLVEDLAWTDANTELFVKALEAYDWDVREHRARLQAALQAGLAVAREQWEQERVPASSCSCPNGCQTHGLPHTMQRPAPGEAPSEETGT